MDNLQYVNVYAREAKLLSFKPYYKWITFNTYGIKWEIRKIIGF